MSDVFISYSREDLAAARRLAAALEEQGWSVFWDRTIPAGRSWRKVIGAALADARCVVVLWSQNSVDSHWVIEEADHGLRRRVLIPAFIERIEPPLGFGSIQAADLSEWDGGRENATIQRFFGDVAGILGPAPVVTAEKRPEAEVEAKRKAEEQERQQAEAEAKRKAEEQQRQRAEAKRRRKAEEKKELVEAEAERKAEQRQPQQADAKPEVNEAFQVKPLLARPGKELLAVRLLYWFVAIDVVAAIAAFLSMMIEIYTVAISGPILFLLGLATLGAWLKHRHWFFLTIGLGHATVPVFLLSITAVYNLDPQTAREPFTVTGSIYLVIILFLGIYALLKGRSTG